MQVRHRKFKAILPVAFHGDVESYELLASAIVEAACRDYIGAKRVVMNAKRSKRREEAEADLNALLRFFHGQWYGELCDIDPDRLIAMLDEGAADPSLTFWLPRRD